MNEQTGGEALQIEPFGEKIRSSLFCLDEGVAFTNHGSFGTVPRPLLEDHVRLLGRIEKQPCSWYRRDVRGVYLSACDAVAGFVGAASSELVLVDNATTAVNTVMRSLRLGPGQGVLVTTLSYRACAITARAVCEETGARLHAMKVTLPVTSSESVVQMYRDYLDIHKDITFALVDHITSPSAVLLPVREIVRVCHERGVMVMVDGAHSPGQLPLNVKDLGAEYFTGNLHKWMFCPRGCAILYVREGLQESVKPLVVSHRYHWGFRESFFSQATRDMTSFCMAPAAIAFFKKIGGLKAVTEYNSSLVNWATDMLCQRLSLSPLPVPADMKAPFMSLVQLPACLGPSTEENEQRLIGKLFHKYNVQTTICSVDGRLCCRICAQVYNVAADYERLAEALEKEIELATKSDKTSE